MTNTPAHRFVTAEPVPAVTTYTEVAEATPPVSADKSTADKGKLKKNTESKE